MSGLVSQSLRWLSGIVLVVMLTACGEDCEPILRGFKEKMAPVIERVTSGESGDSQENAETMVDTATVDAAPEAPDHKEEEYEPLRMLEDYKNNKDRQPLNLSLPSMYWDSSPGEVENNGILPDVFQPLTIDPKMNLSGRLHWDESEQARELSVEDTIKGAEVELQFFLP